MRNKPESKLSPWAGTLKGAFTKQGWGGPGDPGEREGLRKQARRGRGSVSLFPATLGPASPLASQAPVRVSDAEPSWPQSFRCRGLSLCTVCILHHPTCTGSPTPALSSVLPSCDVTDTPWTPPHPMPQPGSPRPQHLVDGRVYHHPSNDLCLVGHLWLLL